MAPEDWLPACLAAQDAGAAMIQLDLFYIPQPRASPRNVRLLNELIVALREGLEIPVAPKMNLDYPAFYAAEILREAEARVAFLIDSVRVPVPLDIRGSGVRSLVDNTNAGECSLFGEWQKPITLQYTRTIAERLKIDLCAGGGLTTGLDAAEALMFGASAVQYATVIIRRGHGWITWMLRQLEDVLRRNGYSSVAELRGLALTALPVEEASIFFDEVRAEINVDLCTMCERCTTQVFCPDIVVDAGKIRVLPECDGCGLCVAACPTKPKALSLVAARGSEGGQ
jgi:dihydroorotate dehydrogenase/Pyruvate/2-oxoacid:ferredoxin oxidoreductase delta subunit